MAFTESKNKMTDKTALFQFASFLSITTVLGALCPTRLIPSQPSGLQSRLGGGGRSNGFVKCDTRHCNVKWLELKGYIKADMLLTRKASLLAHNTFRCPSVCFHSMTTFLPATPHPVKGDKNTKIQTLSVNSCTIVVPDSRFLISNSKICFLSIF